MADVVVLAGSASPGLGASVADFVGVAVDRLQVDRFPDGELAVEVDERVRGRDVYIVQSTHPPGIGDHLLELLLIADAVQRAGAGRTTAIVPYMAYSRQDRRVTGVEPVGGGLVAQMVQAAGIHRVITLELHNPSIAGFYSIPVENLSTVGLLVGALRDMDAELVVAPDLGAAKLAESYGAILGLPVALVHKTRVSGLEVCARSVVGDVQGRRPLIVDDMISTGGTIEAACHAVLDAGCSQPVSIAATHGLLAGPAVERLSKLPVERIVLTNSVPQRHEDPGELIHEVDAGQLIGEAVRRVNENRPLSDLLVHR